MRVDSKVVKHRINAALVITVALFLNAVTVNAVMVNFSVTLVEFTCQTQVSQSKIDFGTLTEFDFQGGTPKIVPFTVTVSDCKGKSNPQRTPGIKVWGEGIDTGNERLFRNRGTSKEYGVRLTYTTSSGGADPIMNGTLIPVGSKGSVPMIAPIDFNATVSCGSRCASAEPGSLSASVTFDFAYE